MINIERDKLGLLTNEKYDLEQEINQFKAALNMMSENNEKLVQENALVVTERDHCSKQIAELR